MAGNRSSRKSSSTACPHSASSVIAMIHLIGQVSEPHEHRAHRCRAVSAANWSTMKDMEVIDQHVECGGQRGLHGCGNGGCSDGGCLRPMMAGGGLGGWLLWLPLTATVAVEWRRQVMVAALAFFQGPAGCVRGSWFFSASKFIERNQNNKETSRWHCHQKTKTKNKSWPPHPTMT